MTIFLRECTIEGCGRIEQLVRGWCQMHYFRWRRHGDASYAMPTTEERFWANIQKTETCWLWTRKLGEGGYAHIFDNGISRIAHRYAYELLVGPIPEGFVLDHVKARGCNHRHCVNPDHLEIVTDKENILRGDGLPAQNARKTHCYQGHEFNEVNTYFINNGRSCRVCGAERSRKSRRKKKDATL